jgi:hypothetical protein
MAAFNREGKVVAAGDQISAVAIVSSVSGTGSLATLTLQPISDSVNTYNVTAYDVHAVQTDPANPAKSIDGKAFGAVGDQVTVRGAVTAVTGSGSTALLTVTLAQSGASVSIPAGSVHSPESH